MQLLLRYNVSIPQVLSLFGLYRVGPWGRGCQLLLRYNVSISQGITLFGLYRVDALGEGCSYYSDTMSLFPPGPISVWSKQR